MSRLVGRLAEELATTQRALEAAMDVEQTRERWSIATEDEIQASLDWHLETAIQRIRHERLNNCYVAGMINVAQDDMIGKSGPILVFTTDDDSWNQRAGEEFQRWWQEGIDYAGQLSGPDLLNLCIGNEFAYGEFFLRVRDAQDMRDDMPSLSYEVLGNEEIPVSLQGGNVAAYPMPHSWPIIRAGVELGSGYVPNRYYVQSEGSWVAAGQIIHYFDKKERSQVRGLPPLTPAIGTVGELRDLDGDILQAQRLAAMLAVLYECDDPGMDDVPDVPLGTIRRFRGTEMQLPAGVKAKQLAPQQPGGNYDSYRKARIGEVGRALSQPYLVAAADASGHNFSSAQLDSRGWSRHLEALQGRIERLVLRKIVAAWLREATMMGVVQPSFAPPRWEWIWQPRDPVDPLKSENATKVALENGTTSLVREIAKRGNVPSRILAEQALTRPPPQNDSETEGEADA